MTVNGAAVPLSIKETLGNVQRISGDISGFAGTTVRLGIASPFGESKSAQAAFDAITFVVPEPDAFLLVATGLLGINFLRRPMHISLCRIATLDGSPAIYRRVGYRVGRVRRVATRDVDRCCRCGGAATPGTRYAILGVFGSQTLIRPTF